MTDNAPTQTQTQRTLQSHPDHQIFDPYANPTDAVPPPASARSPVTTSTPPIPPPTTTIMAHDLTTPNPAQTGGAANTPTPAPAPAAVSSTSVANPNASNGNPVRPGGAPARVYMNEKIVPYLLEGMKGVTREQPANPLRVLGEFLIQKSNEVEGQGQGTSGKAPE